MAARATTAPNTPGAVVAGAACNGTPGPQQSFNFPAGNSAALPESTRTPAPGSRDEFSGPEHVAPVTRVLSPSSISGTPRSSGEFYSLSNNSSETLASEYLSQPPGRTAMQGAHNRKTSNLGPNAQSRAPETLMMGYAQLSGSFTLDGSLISQMPFEEIKRKGAVGGQGGGVIGLKTNKRDSGLLRGFGWGQIGGSIGGILGGGELSSIKEMRGIANSRSIPLLSTPQSILFVDLKLGPGESRSFRYSFKLPKGLPPSHRGKAIKISYKLVIGTQRAGGAREQQVKSVDIPFRVLGSVNNHGEVLGHDLMAPYIILRDEADVRSMDFSLAASRSTRHVTSTKSDESTLKDVLTYIDQLLARPRQNSSLGLLSPTHAPKSNRLSSIEEPTTTKEAIDIAIQHSNLAVESHRSANRFEIARSGKRVAVVMLARPSYRLGETINIAVEFLGAEIPCYAVHASLETSEKIDKGLALRSEASILRVTRKVFESYSESTLCAQRAVFSPTIPTTATPEFITSGVSLEWKIRIEFVTPRLLAGDPDSPGAYVDLIEEIARDDRGLVLAAVEALDCETFEIAVPLRVYGAVTANAERDDVQVEGLVV